jgi:hypothetical protein
MDRIGCGKRLRFYESRLRKAKQLVDKDMHLISVKDEELGIATIRSRAPPAVPGGDDPSPDTGAAGESAVYEVDLSSASCTCPDILAVACKHLLAVAMILPKAAKKFGINSDTVRATVGAPENDVDLTQFLRERARLESEEKEKRPAAAAGVVPSHPAAAPFLEDYEGLRECRIE